MLAFHNRWMKLATMALILFVLSLLIVLSGAALGLWEWSALLPPALFIGIAFLQLYVMSGRYRAAFRVALSLAESTNDGVLISDEKNRILYVNDQLQKMSGYTQDELRGEYPNVFKSGVHGEDFYRNMWRDLKEKDFWQGEIWDKKKNGDLYAKELLIHTLRNRRGKVICYVAIQRDLSELKALEQEKDRLRYFHKESALPSETFVIEKMNQLIAGDVPFQTLYTKITNKAYLNEFHSPDKYVESLQGIRKRLKAKWDGVFALIDSEFFVFLSHKSMEGDFTAFLQSFIDTCEEAFSNGVIFETRLGVSAYPEHGSDAETIYQHAQIAHEKAFEYNNAYMVYHTDMKSEVRGEYEMLEAFKADLQNDRLTLYYQPIFEVGSNAVRGFETLMRWWNEDFSNPSPARFIPLAEKHGLMKEVDAFLIRQAMKDKKRFEAVYGEDVWMSLNVSVPQIHRSACLDVLIERAEEEDVDPASIVIEVTETDFTSQFETLRKQLKKVRGAGFKIALDDFGSGYSSLKRLHAMPMDFVKTDKYFLQSTEDGKRIIQSSVSLGEAFGFDVIAEGVETAEHMAYLRSVHARYAQGFHLARPLPLEEALAYKKRS